MTTETRRRARFVSGLLTLFLLAGCSGSLTDGPSTALAPVATLTMTDFNKDGSVVASRKLSLGAALVDPATPLAAGPDSAFEAFKRTLRVVRAGDTTRVYGAQYLIAMVVKSRHHTTVTSYRAGETATVMEIDTPEGSVQAFAEEEQEPGDYDGPNCLEYLARLAYYTVRSALTCEFGGPYNPICDYYALKMAYYAAKVVIYC